MKCSLLTLSGYVDGELDERRRGEMEAHLVGCARCRAGLGHLREEVERIGALARVHVSDASTHRLLVQLGMIEADDPLPERGVAADERGGALPWLQGATGGGSLPWNPERPRRPAAAPAEPMDPSGPPAAHRRLSALDGVTAVPFDLSVLGGGPPVPLVPRAASTPPGPTPTAPSASAPASPPAAAAPATPAPSLESAPPAAAAPPESAPPFTPLPHPSPSSPPEPAAGPADPDATAASADTAAPHAAPPPSGDTEVAVWTSDPADAPAGADYPLTDEDVLDVALPVERFAGGPLEAPRPRLIDRVRDRMATRRALAGGGTSELDEGVEVVSGNGAPMHARGRSDLARRRADALRPAFALDEIGASPRTPPLREMLAPPARPSAGGTAPAPMHPDVERTGVEAFQVEPRRPSGPEAAPHDLDISVQVEGRMAPRPSAAAGAASRTSTMVAEAPPRPRTRATPAVDPTPAEAATAPPAPRRRSLPREAIVFGLAALLVALTGIVSGRTVTRVPSTTPATAAAAGPALSLPSAPPANSAAGQSSVPAPASDAPSAAPVAAAPVGVGTGGTGWVVQTIRDGDHGTYFRFVFDLAAGTGQPTAVATYPDPRTLVLTISGTTASASLPGVTGTLVKGITVQKGNTGQAIYRITLIRPGTAKLVYAPNPLRLVVDVSPS